MMDTAHFANNIRLRVLELCYRKRTSHIGGAFSVADVLAVLYNGVLDIAPDTTTSVTRDRLFYSKGHACSALYAALELRGFFPELDLLTEFTENGSYFTSHVNHKLAGVELSTGSLGHALGVACGSAIAGKRRSVDYSVFTIVSDGELDEGSNWEAILFASHHGLDNLVLVVDYNKIQSFGTVAEVMALEPLADKFRAFNWEVTEVDGHSLPLLEQSFRTAKATRMGKPHCVIAHTVKGKGVSFMEHQLAWHYQSPRDNDYEAARIELGVV
ncbi:transketolase [Agrobacterium sp. Azo12]|uniref:transketolase n=1 Tax=Agrobacterium sp. Azo12 TaxID=3031129 RepID=UPI0023D82BB9|nr:transketolase [Agrobacterium sp. Azo12]MDO5896966.1 transketolase [Agrobacterium sp. Azo12]